MVALKIAVALAALNILCIDATPVKRDEEDYAPWMVLCKDIYWENCPSDQVLLEFPGGCANLEDFEDGSYAGELSSFDVKKAGFECFWYKNNDCTGDSYEKTGDSNLADGNGEYNDAIHSVQCRWKSWATGDWHWYTSDE